MRNDGAPKLVTLPDLLDDFEADQARRHEEWLKRQAQPEPAPQIKVYRRHYCDRNHRSYRTTAKCLWPRAIWIHGEGPYALLAWCGVLTVTLWRTLEEAQNSKKVIDATDCGHACRGRHEIIRIEMAPAVAADQNV